MITRGSTIHDDIWPDTLPEFNAIADVWPKVVVIEMLSLIWAGFDNLKSKYLNRVDFTKPYEQIERSLTDLHMTEITLLWKRERSGFGSFIPQHEAWEFQTRSSASAKPPSVDLGFVHFNNRRLRWSVEAKVLNNPSDVRRYLLDLNEKYMSGKGSPLSEEAALAAYLIEGSAMDVFPNIEAILKQELKSFSPFSKRAHRVSLHRRLKASLPQGTPAQFRCHHLIMALR
jgi:hypothetical protein